jgi:hypothetical protein
MLAARVSVIPINHATKQPIWDLLPRDRETGKSTWKPYQDALAHPHDVNHWIEKRIEAFAAIGGAISGGAPDVGLLILDFDEPSFYDHWRDAVGDMADDLPVQETGGGGYQVLLRCPDPGGNEGLAWVPDETKLSGRRIAIEIRGEGGYAVMAPSLHPSGNRCAVAEGDLAQIPTVIQAKADTLKAAARKLCQAPFTRQEMEKREAQAIAQHRQIHAKRNGQTSVIDAFNAANDIEDILTRHGYTKRGDRYVRPDGMSGSVSARTDAPSTGAAMTPCVMARAPTGLAAMTPLTSTSHSSTPAISKMRSKRPLKRSG